MIKKIPTGNTFTTDFAKAAIIGEKLGKSEYTDFLTVSYSTTDYMGHQYGVAAKETEDTYLRLDKDLAIILIFRQRSWKRELHAVSNSRSRSSSSTCLPANRKHSRALY